MKENSEVLHSSYPDPYLVQNEDNAVEVTKSGSETGLKDYKKQDQKSTGISLGKVSNDLLSSFKETWHKLVHSPQSFPEKDDTPISTYVIHEDSREEEERMLSTVLSDLLDLQPHSEGLLKALENTNKIYHEDFSGSYILEHNRERLGIFFLEVRNCVNGTSEVSYEFLPGLKSFKYVY
ncbi:hypothetical protein [Autumnicola edwardsiae]|uniref:Uncharacterized protein n=1 Tax=Autumnicola edwardsiae TaxID=3075594 RepID=A0ABU3CW23_9FLAO|nr:hypothetical protein [Zunongwangia sp. F297]MDT0650125.1 hypothetical protein [Zunongwangia sp. F297]